MIDIRTAATEQDQKAAALALPDSDEEKMLHFLSWLKENGATFPSLAVDVGPEGRTVRAKAPIREGELVLHVPRRLMITPKIAKASETGGLAAKVPVTRRHGYLAAFLLDIKRKGGFWKPYVDILPRDLSGHPLFFAESELAYLAGSSCLREIRSRTRQIDAEYQGLIASLPQDQTFTREEYVWARIIVDSRVHRARAFGVETVVLVPLADLLDHSRDYNVEWRIESTLGFLYSSGRQLEPGTPLTISYGSKGNSVLFSNYGFTLEGNPDDDAEIELPDLAPDHPFHEKAKSSGMVRNGMRVFTVTADHEDSAARQLVSFLRLAHLDETTKAGVDAAMDSASLDLPVISPDNETKAMTALQAACKHGLQQFPTSIEEDDALLKEGGLPIKLQHAVRVRRGEKAVLAYFEEFAKTTLAALRAGTSCGASCDKLEEQVECV